jgi:hypothetical protein
MSALNENITAALVFLECAEAKLLKLLPIEETMLAEDFATMEGSSDT